MYSSLGFANFRGAEVDLGNGRGLRDDKSRGKGVGVGLVRFFFTEIPFLILKIHKVVYADVYKYEMLLCFYCVYSSAPVLIF